MADVPDFMLPHMVTVTPQQETGGRGWQPSGPTVTVRCRVDRGRLIRTAGPEGDTVMSSLTVYARLSDAAVFPINAKAVHGSSAYRILQTTEESDGGSGGWEHIEAALG
jgi:hypothetical protein